jgi:hypothetical protein
MSGSNTSRPCGVVVWQELVRDAEDAGDEPAFPVEAVDGADADGERLQNLPGGGGVVPGALEHRPERACSRFRVCARSHAVRSPS